MDLGLKGKVALAAASSRGLGRAVAEELATEGARLILCARGQAALAKVRDEIGARTGTPPTAIAADLTDPAQVERLVDSALAAHGRIDVLVTNTGGPPPGPFEAHSASDWSHAVKQNLDSVLNLTRAVLPGMKERGWGRIVNITSISAKQPVDGLILSNSIRAAVTGFARTLANEVAPFGVTVNNVLPGFTRTERVEQLAAELANRRGVAPENVVADWERSIPMGRLGAPEELGALVAFLASERAAYITGTSIPVDGGWIRSLL